MEKIQFLTILLVVTCFLGGVVSVTDKEFENLVTAVYGQDEMLQKQSAIIGKQSATIEILSASMQRLEADNLAMTEKIIQQDVLIEELTTRAEEGNERLQMTNIELDARVTALEESGGASRANGTMAFHTVLTSYDTIPYPSVVPFNEVLLNEGDGYDSATGTFTVPSGGDGFYYFSAFLSSYPLEYSFFDIRINDDTLCTVYLDQADTDDEGQASCSAVVYAMGGGYLSYTFEGGGGISARTRTGYRPAPSSALPYPSQDQNRVLAVCLLCFHAGGLPC